MIYALAAYSVTIGVLALYLVLLQHRRREYAAALEARGGRGAIDPRTGLNVGALLLAPLWMLRHGLVVPGALLLVAWLAILPLVLRGLWLAALFVAMVPLAAGAALAFVGNRIAVAHTGIEAPGAFSASQLPWAVAGIALYAFVLPAIYYFAIYGQG